MGPLAVAAALFFARVAFNAPCARPALRRQVTAVAAIGIAIPCLAWWAYDLTADPLTYDFSAPIPQHQLVADYIHDHTRPDQRVFVWGDWPALYVESDRLMASRFPGFLPGFRPRPGGAPPHPGKHPPPWDP